jgi:hypothetical protein
MLRKTQNPGTADKPSYKKKFWGKIITSNNFSFGAIAP